MGTRAFLAVLGVLGVLALLGYGVISKGEASLKVGQRAPDRELQRLDGKGTGSISDYRGKHVLVNFWASWCEPCRTESPALQRFYEQNRRRDFVVLGINAEDNTDDARDFARRPNRDQPHVRLTYPLLRVAGEDSRKLREDEFGMTGFPESFLIDPRGRIVLIRRGPVDGDYLERFVAPELRKR